VSRFAVLTRRTVAKRIFETDTNYGDSALNASRPRALLKFYALSPYPDHGVQAASQDMTCLASGGKVFVGSNRIEKKWTMSDWLSRAAALPGRLRSNRRQSDGQCASDRRPFRSRFTAVFTRHDFVTTSCRAAISFVVRECRSAGD